MFHKHYYENDRRSRFFERGDLKYVILDLLTDKSRHGYEIIRELEDRFHGFYTPSAGSVYPTLQLLEDIGYVKSAEQDGKKVYSITDGGKAFLKDREDTMGRIRGHMRDWWRTGNREDFRDIIRGLTGAAAMVGREARELNSAKLARIKEVVVKAGNDIETIVKEKE